MVTANKVFSTFQEILIQLDIADREISYPTALPPGASPIHLTFPWWLCFLDCLVVCPWELHSHITGFLPQTSTKHGHGVPSSGEVEGRHVSPKRALIYQTLLFPVFHCSLTVWTLAGLMLASPVPWHPSQSDLHCTHTAHDVEQENHVHANKNHLEYM